MSAWLDRAKTVIAGGASTLSKRSRAAVEGVSPAAYTRAQAAWFTGDDGRRYLDWTQALGAGLLGYANPVIVEAVTEALHDGVVASVPSVQEAMAAERLIAASPYAQQSAMVRWLNSGTEACLAAVRIARRATGRHDGIVLSSGYHGWAEAFMCLQPVTEGIPATYQAMVQPFGWGDDPGSLDFHGVACVILEPAVFELPPPGYLARLAEATRAAGALLIFDEVVTGFRFRPNEVTSGVVPDMTIYGKSIGGGLPVGVVVGPAAIMRYSDVISGTFCGNAAAMAAVRASLTFLCQHDVAGYIARLGQALMGDLNAVMGDLPVRVVGLPQRMRLDWPGDDDYRQRSLIVQGLARRGVHINQAAILPSWAHTDTDVSLTVSAMRETCEDIRHGIPLAGLPIQPAFRRDT